MIYIFSNKNRCKFFFALILLLTLFLFFRLHRKLKISYFFLFRSKSLYLHQFQEQSEAMQRNPHSYQIATGYRTLYSLSLIYQPITKKRLFLLKKLLNNNYMGTRKIICMGSLFFLSVAIPYERQTSIRGGCSRTI